MWHASIAARFAVPGVSREAVLFDEAVGQLAGVGDPALGEWREVGDRAVHLRRRLTPAEMTYAGIEAVCDVRGSDEFVRRIARMRPFLPPQMALLPDHAFP